MVRHKQEGGAFMVVSQPDDDTLWFVCCREADGVVDHPGECQYDSPDLFELIPEEDE